MRFLSCPTDRDRVVATRSKVEGRRVDPEVQLEVIKAFLIWLCVVWVTAWQES